MQASEIARRLNQTWAMYSNEVLASVDERSGYPGLSRSCGWFSDVRRVLHAAVAGDYTPVPDAVRGAIVEVPDHIRDKHPEYWHLFFDDPGPAARALEDQLDACRREATERFGPEHTKDGDNAG